MSAPNFAKKIQDNLADLKRVVYDRIPRRVGKEVADSIEDNFRRGSFYGGSRWDTPVRTKAGFRGAAGQYGPLLSANSGRNDSLMGANTWRIAGPGLVRIYNPVPYAPYNNDGAVIVVTEKMRRFFWARHAEEAERLGKDSPEALFWRNMALKKPGSRIVLPRRQFIGPGQQVDRIVTKVIEQELQQFINRINNNGTTTT